MSTGEHPKVSQVSPGLDQNAEFLSDGADWRRGLTQPYNHCMRAHLGRGTGSLRESLAGDEAPRARHMPSLTCKKPGGAQDPPSTSLCVSTMDGGFTLSVLFDPQTTLAKRYQPLDEEWSTEMSRASPRTHNTRDGITQHFLCRAGEMRHRMGVETSRS